VLGFSKNDVENTQLANILTLFGYFHILIYQVLKM